MTGIFGMTWVGFALFVIGTVLFLAAFDLSWWRGISAVVGIGLIAAGTVEDKT